MNAVYVLLNGGCYDGGHYHSVHLTLDSAKTEAQRLNDDMRRLMGWELVPLSWRERGSSIEANDGVTCDYEIHKETPRS